jgi:hypothetical protein
LNNEEVTDHVIDSVRPATASIPPYDTRGTCTVERDTSIFISKTLRPKGSRFVSTNAASIRQPRTASVQRLIDRPLIELPKSIDSGGRLNASRPKRPLVKYRPSHKATTSKPDEGDVEMERIRKSVFYLLTINSATD